MEHNTNYAALSLFVLCEDFKKKRKEKEDKLRKKKKQKGKKKRKKMYVWEAHKKKN